MNNNIGFFFSGFNVLKNTAPNPYIGSHGPYNIPQLFNTPNVI